MTAPDLVDAELLDLADGVLRQAEYAVERTTVADVDCLLAENSDCVLAVAALVSVEAVVEAQASLAQALVQRVGLAPESPKRWDAYLVLLTVGNIDDIHAEPLFDLAYDLSQVRRIVRSGVRPTVADVERALRPVLPLAGVDRDLNPSDVISALQARLVADGMDKAEVESLIAEFRSTAGDFEEELESVEE